MMSIVQAVAIKKHSNRETLGTRLKRTDKFLFTLFVSPRMLSVNGVNSLTHITLTRVTDFFSDVKSGFDSKMKTEQIKKIKIR